MRHDLGMASCGPPGRALRRAGALALATLAAAGCSAGGGAPPGATVASCYVFSVQALQRHVTVTTMPPACAGLSHEQVNLAVDRAIRTVVGPRHKAAGRRLAHRESAYLAYLVTVAPPRPARPATAPAGHRGGLPLGLAALAAWVLTAGAGAWLLAGWIAGGGLRRRYARVSGVPRVVVVGHFGLAVTGLGIWIGFMATGATALAWAAVGVVLSVAGLGMATLVGGLPRARAAACDAPAWAGKPVIVIALHGTLAAATILLVVLAAIGAR